MLVFDPKGKLIRSFYAGDGIETAVVDQRNRIWIGYFDEGVFGAAGFAYRGVPRDHSCYRYGPNGLIRLSDRGEIELAYNSQFGHEPGRFIDWICTLTVSEDRCWFSAASKGFVGSVLNDQVEYVLHRSPSALRWNQSRFMFRSIQDVLDGGRGRSQHTICQAHPVAT